MRATIDMLAIALDRVGFLPSNRVTDNSAILTLKNWVFEPLCRWDDGVVRPALFGRWEHDATGRRWRFELRDGARFHDGTACTADDVLAFLHAILESRDMFGMRWAYSRYFDGVAMHAETARIVRFEAPRAFGDLPEILTEFYLSRLDRQGRAVIGTGPYRVIDFTPCHDVLLHPVSSNAPLIHALAVPRAEDRLEQVRAGAVDIACGLEQCEEHPHFDAALHWLRAVNTLSVMYYLNCTEGPFTHPDVRMAANLAVDKARIVADLFGGLAVPAATIVSPAHLGFRSAGVQPIPYDPDAARRLLDAAGGERRIRLRTPEYMPERAPAISAMVADNLAAIGFEVAIELATDRPEYAREIGAGRMGDMAIFDSSPHSSFRVLNDKISSQVRGTWWQGFDDPETERLIDAADAALGDAERETAYGRCLARLRQMPPWLYLFHPMRIAATRRGIAPVTLDSKGVVSFGPAPLLQPGISMS